MSFGTLRRFVIAAGLLITVHTIALCQQPSGPNPGAVRPSWAVTVVHRIDLQKLISRLERDQNLRVGIIGGIADPVNISTGLVVDESGHVITRLGNVDPTDKNENISVVTRDGETHKATLVGVDLASGFAVLEVDSLKGSPAAPITTAQPSAGTTLRVLSTDVQPELGKTPGQILIFPSFRVDSATVAASSFYSEVRGAITLKSPDLSPRNDSGIITTSDFEVLGVAQAGSVTSGTAYLFPIEFLKSFIVKRVLDKNESVPAGWLGVSGVAMAQLPETEQVPLGSTTGVVVKDIVAHSAAETAGIHLNDVIVGLDGFNIKEVADMSTVLAACPAGEKIHIREIRQGKPVEIDAVLGAREIRPLVSATFAPPGQSLSSAPYDSQGQSVNPSLFEYPGSSLEEAIPIGFSARDLTPQLARFFGADGGVLITSVVAGSQADRAGLKVGDVLVSGNPGAPLKLHLLKSILGPSSGTASLKVIRAKKPISIDITPDADSSKT